MGCRELPLDRERGRGGERPRARGRTRQLTKTDGLLVSKPTTILVLGTDGGNRPGREGANRSDSIMLLRTDPGKRRLAYLSIPRDLQVEIPDVGFSKINAANQIGGPALALRTVEDLTGLDVNHVAFVDFDRFEELIDAVGGIEVNVPRRIRSNKFDCPYKTAARCARGRAGASSAAPAHGRPPGARLLADPAEPPEPARDGLRPGAPPAAGHLRDARQGDEPRHRA